MKRSQNYALAVLLILMAMCPKIRAQELPLPSIALAVTYCDHGIVRTALDATILNDSLLPEILAHEAVHQRQYAARMKGKAVCPAPYTLPVLLVDEIGAYCQTLNVRMRRGFTREEARGQALSHLLWRFGHFLGVRHVVSQFEARCT